ncbi:phage baseplate assembly protein V [Alterluteimonas muca]|uniref:phage baseplate assembly protein V n=1 Tax=Alterluteimonas muca TaxID=2878684 RepID=UPI003F4A6CEA
MPVAEWLAGPNWGSHFLPRIGAEVLVEFLHGDIDQPRITGQLYNGDVAPPFAAGIDGGANHPGTLSGLHTRGHDGGGTQQWVIDDTPGQLRTRLHTTACDAPCRRRTGKAIGRHPTIRGRSPGVKSPTWLVTVPPTPTPTATLTFPKAPAHCPSGVEEGLSNSTQLGDNSAPQRG